MDFILYYMGIGYVVNNILALISLYGDDEGGELEVDIPNFILTIPAWPYTLYNVIAAFFSRGE